MPARDQNESQREDQLLLPREEGPRTSDHLDNISTAGFTLDKLVFYFMIIHFLLAFCEIILVAPLIKLFEESLCLSHYNFPAGGVEEVLCKIPEIQRPLATIR
jgi:hypothetical protein